MEERDILFAAKLLQQGSVVAIPTETVYGLAANAFNESAVSKIFEIKNRPTYNPLIVHVKSVEALRSIVKGFPDAALKLANAFWPGPLTLVLKKQNIIPDLVTGGHDTVAVRIPRHPVALKLLNALDFPLAAPSANPFGYISPTTAEHVRGMLQNKVPFILNGGACSKGVESTIIGFQDNLPVLLRKGAIDQESIENISGPLILVNNKDKVLAPGMLSKHYSPNTPLLISDNIPETIYQYKYKRVGLLLFSKNYNIKMAVDQRILSKSGSLEEAASKLYACMHDLEQKNLDIIIAERFPDKGLGRTLNDRLIRASVKS